MHARMKREKTRTKKKKTGLRTAIIHTYIQYMYVDISILHTYIQYMRVDIHSKHTPENKCLLVYVYTSYTRLKKKTGLRIAILHTYIQYMYADIQFYTHTVHVCRYTILYTHTVHVCRYTILYTHTVHVRRLQVYTHTVRACRYTILHTYRTCVYIYPANTHPRMCLLFYVYIIHICIHHTHMYTSYTCEKKNMPLSLCDTS